MKKLEYYRKEKFEHYGNKYKNKLTYTDREKETKMFLLEYVSQNRWHPVKVGSMKSEFPYLNDYLETLCLYESGLGDPEELEITDITITNVDFHFNGDFTITVLFNDEFCIPEYEQDADGWSRVK